MLELSEATKVLPETRTHLQIFLDTACEVFAIKVCTPADAKPSSAPSSKQRETSKVPIDLLLTTLPVEVMAAVGSFMTRTERPSVVLTPFAA